VDALAANIVGPICAGAAGSSETLDRWSRDDDFWIRRSALLSQLRPLRDGAPLDRFAAYADGMLDEKEFFIRKAIGWVLREAGKQRPDDVVEWLTPRAKRVSGVTMREAVKYLPEGDGAALMTAHRRRTRR
jgi:3-methyladenine DNA glycosylase AlkD